MSTSGEASSMIIPTCQDCEQRDAAVTCPDCEMTYCSECSRRIHAKGALARHGFRPLQAPSGRAQESLGSVDRAGALSVRDPNVGAARVHTPSKLSAPRRVSAVQYHDENEENEEVAVVATTMAVADKHSKADKRAWVKDDFNVGRALGRGKFGIVYLAKEQASQRNVALKVIFKNTITSTRTYLLLRREVEIQIRLRHPNILRLYGYFHDHKSCYLVLEYAPGGELYRLMRRVPENRLDEATAASYVRQVADALHYLHQFHVIHRDIKPENMLLTSNPFSKDKRSGGGDSSWPATIKICDFGWSIHAPPPCHKRTTMCGTPEYLPPEIVAGLDYDIGVDVWALGIFAYELLTGVTPFVATPESRVGRESGTADGQAEEPTDDRQIREELYERILDYTGTLSWASHHHHSSKAVNPSPAAKEMIQALLHPNPAQRMTAEEALQAPWLAAAGAESY